MKKNILFLLLILITAAFLCLPIVCCAEPLPAPANVTVTQTGPLTYRISWDKVDGAVKYKVQILPPIPEWLDEGETEECFYDLQYSADLNTVDYYRVVAVDQDSVNSLPSIVIAVDMSEINLVNVIPGWDSWEHEIRNRLIIEYLTCYGEGGQAAEQGKESKSEFAEIYRKEGDGEYQLIYTLPLGFFYENSHTDSFTRVFVDTEIKPETTYSYYIQKKFVSDSIPLSGVLTDPEISEEAKQQIRDLQINNIPPVFRAMPSEPKEVTTKKVHAAPELTIALELNTLLDEDCYWAHISWSDDPDADSYQILYCYSDRTDDVYTDMNQYKDADQETFLPIQTQTGINFDIQPISESEENGWFTSTAIYHIPAGNSIQSGMITDDNPAVYTENNHFLVKYAKTEATCICSGHEEYWQCAVCGKQYSDKNATSEINDPVIIPVTAHALIKHDKAEPTSTEKGTEAYWECTACGKMFSDEYGTSEIDKPVEIPKNEKEEIDEPANPEPVNSDPENPEQEKTETEDTEPEQTEPENTEPEQTEPENTEPEQTEPENTEPEQTEPENTEPENTEPADPQSRGWVNTDAGWTYVQDDGTKATGWLADGGAWYYMNANGVMQTGWVSDGGVWYYMKSSGAMATGWVSDGGVWYYMKPSGAMATGWIYDGAWYYMKSSGAMATGWIYDGAWYYMKPSGAMATGWVSDGGAWYYMRSSGAMATGWIYDGAWYYLKPSGAMATGWFEDKDAEEALPANQKRVIWYWFDNNGTMATGWKEIDGQWEMFADSGEWLYTWQANGYEEGNG